MYVHVVIGMKENRDLGGGKWLAWGQGPDPCFPAPPQERWCPPPPGHGAMYNGIGLPTPRGSGTNGYVQRNLSLVRGRRGERPDYKGEEELRRLEAALVKRPNPDILDHERKRRVELRCLELEEMMEEQG